MSATLSPEGKQETDKEIIFTRHHNTVGPRMLAYNRKTTLQAIHTDTVNKAFKDQKKYIVLDDLPHQSTTSQEVTRHPRTVKIRIL